MTFEPGVAAPLFEVKVAGVIPYDAAPTVAFFSMR
jgi:hypothetical protein